MDHQHKIINITNTSHVLFNVCKCDIFRCSDVCGVFVVVKCSLCEVLGVCVAIVYLFCHANVDAKYSAS